MGGVWYLYGTCFTAPHVAPRPLYKGNAEDDVRSRPFFACRRRKTCMPQEPSSLGTNIRFALGKPHVPTVGEPIFLATRGYLPCHKRHSCVRVTRISQRAWHRVPILILSYSCQNFSRFFAPYRVLVYLCTCVLWKI